MHALYIHTVCDRSKTMDRIDLAGVAFYAAILAVIYLFGTPPDRWYPGANDEVPMVTYP